MNVETFFRLCRIPPYNYEDLFKLKLGETYVVGSIRTTAQHSKWGLKNMVTQALLTRIHGALRYEAFSNYCLIKPRKAIYTTGQFKINAREKQIGIEPPFTPEFKDFIRVCRYFGCIETHMTMDDMDIFMRLGFFPVLACAILDKDKKAISSFPVPNDEGQLESIRHDFSNSDYFISAEELKHSGFFYPSTPALTNVH